MTIVTRPAPSPFPQPLRRLAPRWMPPRTIERATRPSRHRGPAHPTPRPIDLWAIDHDQLRRALDESWR